MDLLGPSLEDLFVYCGRKFSLKTVLLLADQMVSCVSIVSHYSGPWMPTSQLLSVLTASLIYEGIGIVMHIVFCKTYLWLLLLFWKGHGSYNSIFFKLEIVCFLSIGWTFSWTNYGVKLKQLPKVPY